MFRHVSEVRHGGEAVLQKGAGEGFDLADADGLPLQVMPSD
jgi:hypothetical protein